VKEEVNREVRFEELQKLQSEIKQSVEQEAAALRTNIHAPSRPVKTKKIAKIAKSTPKKRVKAKVDDAN
jgi:hypothetical protein